MACDHQPTQVSIVDRDGTTVVIEAGCRHCGDHLWASVELMAVGEHSVGDQFEGPEGCCWTILDPKTPGPAGSAGKRFEQLHDPLADRAVGVHLRADDGDEQWFRQDQFESIVGDILEEGP